MLKAIHSFEKFSATDLHLIKKWERFHTDGIIVGQRPTVAASWKRSKMYDIDYSLKQVPLLYQTDNELHEMKEQNQTLLHFAAPFIQQLYSEVSHEDINIVLSNEQGILIDQLVPVHIQKEVEKISFVPGADLSELAVGTNAIGTALVEKKPVQIFSGEHFVEGGLPWVCSAAPILDPLTNEVLGILNMTGNKKVVQAHDLNLVINYALKIQKAIVTPHHTLINQTIFDHVAQPIVIFDIKGRITQCNVPAKQLLKIHNGISVSELLGRTSFTEIQRLLGRNELQELMTVKDGTEWKLKVDAYQIGEHLLGGVLLFEKGKEVVQESSHSHQTRYHLDQIIAADPAMLKLKEKVKKASYSESNVLISGESGTGKELIAQSLHSSGPRAHQPFVSINCGAIPKELLSSELFGYDGGAFTGAKAKGKKGKFILANNGTIFLDEVAELPFELQVYLLRVLEEREIVPIGGEKSIPIQVRVIVASHKNLKEEVKKGTFRQDLYYRLQVISLHVPPLRDRKKDIPLLVDDCLKKLGKKEGAACLEAGVMETLLNYNWEGNIRELKNSIEYALFQAETDYISLTDFPEEISCIANRSSKQQESSNLVTFRSKIDQPMLIEALNQTGGNITHAAKMLNTSRVTIYRKIKEFNL
ncbi:sigma-54-dependent Fis family transcriptional regulator [Halalkalibacter krulwichiae]|uniref:Acetoin dehydrogenase operon transcriptional activator AcoR n=1 Tax=Halalkalibacter krulwichiae TaxID=199441 RepID=A0A1X9MLD6_9BACI|nr:sigma-54-dependent Fis family transcriptional regulator [Halalkalibacter krulwichiae]ARK32651.1 Acetoin dehydrogenase operon transcriptional activator AcoR [Halalkalibacter krulwichiae]